MTRRTYPPLTRPRLARALLRVLAAGPGDAEALHARLEARRRRPVPFVVAVTELHALEGLGHAASRRMRHHPEPLRRMCRKFAITRAGRRALIRSPAR